jgi:hypothetical protein
MSHFLEEYLTTELEDSTVVNTVVGFDDFTCWAS